ncbi:hypothetical protein J1G42_02425 [Cellulomonas sp. zg-ZUI222]|uniref:hypothetical protein n=1 Tax=Cellulomonas wangleii TaxID=2816956 RepID=UPI001A93C62A|nr:hypothetical protein [Cellulomonas wangleii]MBO0919679.1 hypothetical protein [Cellulomonas wangleii]
MGVRDGLSLTLDGRGHVLVDPGELQEAAARLRGAAERLDTADVRLGSAAWRAGDLAALLPQAHALGDALATLRRAVHGPAGLADDVRDLATRTAEAAAVYDLAETAAQARWAGVVGALGLAVGIGPFGPAALLTAAAGVAVGDLLLAEARDLALAPGGRTSPGDALAELTDLVDVPRRIVTDGRAALVLQLLAAALGSVAGASAPQLDPVRRFSALVAGLLPARDVRLVSRTDPPRLPAPRGVEGLVDLAARTYDEGTATGEPGTPLATVTLQRLDHADGSRSWVVAVPGTRAAGLTGDVPTDNGTNLALEGGVPDVMTRAVLAAMAGAGIGPDEPVALVGHSQGGMVATNVAAATAGAYAVRLVVTAGSPDVPAVPPPGVATVTLRHREDAVSLLDGRVGERGGPGTLSVVRDLAATGGPVRPSFSEAHAVAGYVRTGALVDQALADAPVGDPVRRALAEVLGDTPAGATTSQVTVTTGSPVVPATPGVLPVPPVMRPAPPAPPDGTFGEPAAWPPPAPGLLTRDALGAGAGGAVSPGPTTSSTTGRS